MKDMQGKEQKAYLVRDKKTGAVAITYESYAKKLQRDGTKKIIAQEGERAFKEGKIREVK